MPELMRCLPRAAQADADTALSYALRCGLGDAGLLLSLAEVFGAAGRLREQQNVLQVRPRGAHQPPAAQAPAWAIHALDETPPRRP